MTRADRFNSSGFGRFINSAGGRTFRFSAGLAFLVIGIRYFDTPGGKASLLWSFFPLTAGGLDICWISASMGGPMRGTACRADASAVR
ncbi:MAG: hypothetical protein ABIM89_05605 [Mycobacteriales bacterium]